MPKYNNDFTFGATTEEPAEVFHPWEEQPITIPLLEYVTLKTRIERLIMEKEAVTSKWYELQRELSTLRENGGE